MTNILKDENRSLPEQRPVAMPKMKDATDARPSKALPIGRAFSRFCTLVGYAIVVTIVAAGLLELGARMVWFIHPLTRQAELENQIGSPVYDGADWAREFWQEESARRKKTTVYVPFRIWGVTSWHGKYINNDEVAESFLRRTINPANCSPANRLNVWTFGGSTMYGTAVPDWATIPSYLSRELNSGSQGCTVVTNFGVEGYVTDQELILLEEQLKAGGRPDVVIFYDGVNDSSLAWPPGRPNPHFLFRVVKTRVEGSLSGRLDFIQKSYALRLVVESMSRLRPAASFKSLVDRAQPNVLATLENYQGNMRLARALGDVYKFKVFCFWQPMLTYGHKPLVPFEQHMAARDATGTSAESAWFLTMNQVYQEAERRARSSRDVIFLTGLFDSTKEPVYVDEAHLGPRGNEIVAQAMAKYIEDGSKK